MTRRMLALAMALMLAAIPGYAGSCATYDEFPGYTTPWDTDEITYLDAWATSELYEKKYDHSASCAFDGNFSTAWVEGVDGLGEGETVCGQWDVSGEWWLVGVCIANGYQKSTSAFENNAAPDWVTLTVNGESFSAQLGRAWGWQAVGFDEPVNVSGGFTLGFTIDSATGGDRYQDSCVTELLPLLIPTTSEYRGFALGFGAEGGTSDPEMGTDYIEGAEAVRASCETLVTYEDGSYLYSYGWSESDELVWSRVDHCTFTTELDTVAAFQTGDLWLVYNADEGLIALDLATGNEKWFLSAAELDYTAGVCCAVGPGNVIYLGGYYGPDPIAISPEGNILWRADLSDMDIYWLYEIFPTKTGIECSYESIYGSSGVVTFDYDGNLLDLDF